MKRGTQLEERNQNNSVFLFLLVESMSCAHGGVLAHRALYEESRDADDEHADEVGEEEGRAAVLVAQVGKPPHVPQAHSIPNHGEDEVEPEKDQTSWR